MYHTELKMDITEQLAMLVGIEKKYSELVMAVSRKYPDETRHETALRYITDAEQDNTERGQDEPHLQ